MGNVPLEKLKPTHDIEQIHAAIKVMKQHGCPMRTAIDVGANRGHWTRVMLDSFEDVVAIEPNLNCFADLPVESINYNLAVADTIQSGAIVEGRYNDGQNHIEFGEGPIPVVTIDSLFLDAVNFIKIDIEGGELFALKGASHTIAMDQPWIMVEENGLDEKHYGLKRDAASRYLETIGYKKIAEWGKNDLNRLFCHER